ncbi:alpha/beta fold hydrolase [Streptodolium elevatio]|uniref:Alpha/beta fold hydrolase n=1 Tax=Streptodolium elevatio TaxID=3157996 RepID=A0ABV3DVU9_9ACTN
MSDTIVFGATGFIGRSLVAELLGRGRRVAAAARGNGAGLTAWLDDQQIDTGGLELVRADITVPGLGIPSDALPRVRDVYNSAGRYAFGLSAADAKAANVTGARHVVDWAASRPDLRRLVHVSGYRVSGADSPAPDYRKLGAYEASKAEGDAAVRQRARELGVPLTIANPSSVLGPGQYIGLAGMVADLWRGKLRALPGGSDVFVPVVTLDHFVGVLANLPEHADTAGQAYWILDDTTPDLPELIAEVAAHLGVLAPRCGIPVGLVRRLPRALTGADPETLSFLSADRYPTGPANAFAEATGVHVPPVADALRAWADHLVATRFGAGTPSRRPSGFHTVGGSRTWVAGERRRPDYVLLHGLPLDTDSWTDVADRLAGPVLGADLPGLGRSAPGKVTTDAWLADLMEPVAIRPVLVAHSLAAGPALRYAANHPEHISGLVLLAPSFLLRPSSPTARSPLAALALRRADAARLARVLALPPGPATDRATQAAAAHLKRPGAAKRLVRALRAGHASRTELRRLLDEITVPVHLVIGAQDPLVSPTDLPTTVVDAAGHYPQLTAPETVAHILTTFQDRHGLGASDRP